MKKSNKSKGKKIYSKDKNKYIGEAIKRPDSRDDKTNMAIPDDRDVEIAREWIERNQL